jgi:hypothetical protein
MSEQIVGRSRRGRTRVGLRLAAPALLLAAGLAATPAADAATVHEVTPHVFANGETLIDIGREGLHPWGFYDGSKGLVAAARASRGTPAPGGTPVPAGTPSAGAGGNTGSPFGELRRAGPCWWGHPGFGAPAHRDRCGHPAIVTAFTGAPPAGFAAGGGGGGRGGGPGGGGSIPPGGPDTPAPIPLPASIWLILAGLGLLGLGSRRA